MATRIINVANRLPITVGDQEIKKSSGGLVAALEGLPRDQYTIQWIGWPGGVIAPDRRAQVEEVLTNQYGAIPVYLTDEEEAGFYSGFANASLWPVLHYMSSLMRYEPLWWEQYQRVNRLFADRVLEVVNDGDVVWVHDYQLMLLPAMLKHARPNLRIGFFLHTPFPSYEVFRMHPRREELLRGMLGADQIGFHTPGYMRHFRSALLRLLGLSPEISSVRVSGRTSYFGIYPIGINACKFDEELASPAYAEQMEKLRVQMRGRKLVVSIERMDYTKGILHRLDAIDVFLANCPLREKVQFIFVSVPSREDVSEYQTLRSEVETRVGHLNGKYATLENHPIHFIHGSVPFPQLCALYAMADVGLVTPLIDGMNLVAKEYVAAHKERPGVLILSEFAGAAEEMFDAVIVNPYDVHAVAQSIQMSLEMSDGEKWARMMPMRQRVMKFDSPWWARMFLNDLQERDIGWEVRMNAAEAGEKIKRAVAAGQKVGMFLDYDGTLREFVRDPAMARPTPAMQALFEKLQQVPNLNITIISGRKQEDLEAWLGMYRFGLVAEHGAAIRRAGQPAWEQLDRNVNYGWKAEVAKVLHVYTDLTPGSWVEEKRTSLVWHYRTAEPEYGTWRANELTSELTTITANAPVQVRHGKKMVEITTSQISKGAAVQQMAEGAGYKLVVCAGDDLTDESMFALTFPGMLKIKVGEGETRAEYMVPTPADLRKLLESAI